MKAGGFMVFHPKVEKTLAHCHPEISKSWHPVKNGTLTPRDVSYGSGRKVWWLCEKGHEWEATVNHRHKGQGCPYCSGRYASADENLALSNPDIARQWHPSKNPGLTPNDVRPGSHAKVWWLCSHGHEWESTVKNRVLGKDCPYCAGKLATPEENLLTLYPDVARLWHPEKNGDLLPSSLGLRATKRYGGNASVDTNGRPESRTERRAISCPFCWTKTSGIEIRIFTELKTLFPEVEWRAKLDNVEIDIYLPTEKIGIEVDGHYWHHDREVPDGEKGLHLERFGITLVRLREKPLGKLGKYDIEYATREKEKTIVNRLVECLLPIVIQVF